MTSDPEGWKAGKEVNSSSSPAVAAAPNGATDTQHSAGETWHERFAGFVRRRNYAEALAMLRATGPLREGLAEAFHDGFLCALGATPWADASDFAILVGLSYADGKEPPNTMPGPLVRPAGWGNVRAYAKAVARELANLPEPEPSSGEQSSQSVAKQPADDLLKMNNNTSPTSAGERELVERLRDERYRLGLPRLERLLEEAASALTAQSQRIAELEGANERLAKLGRIIERERDELAERLLWQRAGQ